MMPFMHEAIKTIIQDLLAALGASYTGVAHSEVAGQIIFTITTDDGRALIGAHGDTAHSIDMLVKKIYEKKFPQTEGVSTLMFIVDINDYRAKQIKDLQTKALMMADRARSLEYDVELTPMSGYERLIIHTALQDAPNVKTESQGEGRDRRVVIKYSAE